eukprot:6172667-Pleurochrysis_carterae.AAC.7
MNVSEVIQISGIKIKVTQRHLGLVPLKAGAVCALTFKHVVGITDFNTSSRTTLPQNMKRKKVPEAKIPRAVSA